MAERVGRAALVSLVSAGTGAVAGLALSVVVGRAYGDAGAGVFFAVVAVFTITANVLELGADTGLVRQLSRLQAVGRSDRVRPTLRVAVVPVLLVGIPAVVLLWWLLPGLLDDATGDAVRSVLPLALAASLLAVVLGATRGLGRILPFTAVWNIGLPVARPLLVLAVAATGLGVDAAVRAWAWAVVPALLVAVLLTHRAVRAVDHHTRRDPAPVTAPDAAGLDRREFWSFSAPRGVAAALEIMLSWADVVLVAVLASPAAAGVYAVVTRAVTAGLLVDSAARVAVSPRLSALMAVGDRTGAAALQTTATGGMVLLSWPFYLTLAVFGPGVLGLFGEDFVRGSTALVLLCAAMMLMIAAGMTQTLLLMGGRSHWQMGNKAVALGVVVVGNVVLVPRIGVEGAAIAWALAIVVDTALAVHQVRDRMHVPLRLRAQRFPAVLALVCTAAAAAPAVLLAGRGLDGLALHAALLVPLYAVAGWFARHRLGLSPDLLRRDRSRAALTGAP